jgi:hypothetical protein
MEPSPIDRLYRCGVKLLDGDVLAFEKLLSNEIEQTECICNGSIFEGVNISILFYKQIQRDVTQRELNYKYTSTNSGGGLLNNKDEQFNFEEERDRNIFTSINDFLDLKKPKYIVLMKFLDREQVECVKYKRIQNISPASAANVGHNLPWLTFWKDEMSDLCLEYCTDIFQICEVFGHLFGIINLSNLLGRIERKSKQNLTLLLTCITLINKSVFINPISRYGKIEENEIFKSIFYEDVKRKMLRLPKTTDKLIYSRTRNMFDLPSIQGTNLNDFVELA